ncbi:GDSL esterase/lipase At5g42170-like [Tasmannia lanceolata]|uniref:GDSL esterase/lipase At5g42170-like n=1 Tax=Tasmannia lanceolata TaxID=3420 RepID=UPI004062C7A7
MHFFSFLRALSSMLSLLLVLVQILKAQTLNPNQALLAFGDSILDTGNNNMLPTVLKANFPPYGRDFIGQKATGRFGNGKIISDLIASGLGIKELLPAYLDPELNSQDLLTGVSFASGGTGYDNLTAQMDHLLSMWDQLELFKEYIEKLKEVAGDEKARSIVSDSLYIVSAGNNDLLRTYFDSTPIRRIEYDIPSYIHLLVQSASSFIQELHQLGAQRIAVLGVFPLACLPAQRTLRGGLKRDCDKELFAASVNFNIQLSSKLKSVSAQLQDSKIVYIDVHSNVLDIITHPQNYGFQEVKVACCGTGLVEVAILCNELSPTCSNPSNYFFWDAIHPTERACEIIAPWILQSWIPFLN